MDQLNLFSEKDQKLRKKWRITWPFVVAFELLTVALVAIDKAKPMELFGFVALFLIGVNFLLYYFGYRKQGTKFLFFYLIMPLSQSGKKIKELQSDLNAPSDELVYILIGLGITLAIYGWWYYLNYRLYTMNKGFNPSKACRKEIAAMEQVQSSEELEFKYQELVNAHCNFEPAITRAYQKKRALL